MAKTRNTFIKSKMNRDLDQRLLPNGEYREALNIQVSQSEGADVGTLSNSLGNTSISDFGLEDDCNAKIIGIYADEKDKNIFIFITNFIDTSNTGLTSYPPPTVINQIWVRNIDSNTDTKLVEGQFLNFSITHPIISVNLLQDLLFFTDNRNQPRKINFKSANPSSSTSPTYYTNEDQICVAKYAPCDTIDLMKDFIVTYTVISNGGGNPTQSANYKVGDILPTISQRANGGQGLFVEILQVTGFGNIRQLRFVSQGFGYITGERVKINPRAGSAEIELTVENQSSMKNKCDKDLPETFTFTIGTQYTIISGVPFQQESAFLADAPKWLGSTVSFTDSAGFDVTPDGAYVSGLDSQGQGGIIITWPYWTAAGVDGTVVLPVGSKIKFGLNPDYDDLWPGDCEYLKDKFVRFAYRFKFDDNEYSLISPFTQACFIPKQNGYFLTKEKETESVQSLIKTGTGTGYVVGDTSDITDSSGNTSAQARITDTSGNTEIINGGDGYTNGGNASLSLSGGTGASYTINTFANITDAKAAFESTENPIFENSVNSVALQIPCPIFLGGTSFSNTWNNASELMHITDIEIIYKDDSEEVLKVVESIPVSTLINLKQPFLDYEYKSTIPIKALDPDETIRVSDKVPVRALAQEVSGNRIIYGNYVDGHTSNATLDYELASGAKFPTTTPFFSTLEKEYQNHTLKQNRSYQVGIILADRYGRQSDVVLARNADSVSGFGTDTIYGSSTTFHPFYNINPGLINGTTTWPGDCLKIQFNSLVPEDNGLLGYPGLFVAPTQAFVNSFSPGGPYIVSGAYPLNPVVAAATTTNGSGIGLTVDYWTSQSTPGLMGPNAPIVNNPGFGYQDGDIINISSNVTPPPSNFQTASFILRTEIVPNLTGWYSYRVVVKQQEQDYYNVYLPGIVNGTLRAGESSSADAATLSLYGDNINKIPKDLTDVGPTQTSFRTSDESLSLRVQNVFNNKISRQFFPGTETENVVTLSELSDLGFVLSRTTLAISGAYPNGSQQIGFTTFSENVSNGSAVVIQDNNGKIVYSASDGVYIRTYFEDTSPVASAILNKSVILPIGGTYTAIISPAGVIYNGENNPVVGSLQTSASIGVSEENNFIPILSVFETAPIKSQLEIFYETSSSGTITSLNELITEGSVGGISLAGISPILSSTVLFNETKLGSYLVTDPFTPIDFNNDPINDQAALGEIVSVFDDNQTSRINEFKIDGPSSSNGSFTVSTNNASNAGYYRGISPNPSTFNVTAKIISQGASVFKSFQLELGNSAPVYGPSRHAQPNPLLGTNYTSSLNGTPSQPNMPLLQAFPTNAQLVGPLGMVRPLSRSSRDSDYGVKFDASFIAFNGSADKRPTQNITPGSYLSQYPLLQESLATREITWELLEWVIGPNTYGVDFNNQPNTFIAIPGPNGGRISVKASDIEGNFPTVILGPNAIQEPKTQNYQIRIGDDYMQGSDRLKFGGITDKDQIAFSASGLFIMSGGNGGFISPGTSGFLPIGAVTDVIQGNKCKIFIRPLSGTIANNLTYDPDGDPSGLQQGAANFLNFLGNNNNFLGGNTTAGNINPYPVGSLPLAAFVGQIEYKIKIQARDGGNFVGEPSVITLIQQGGGGFFG